MSKTRATVVWYCPQDNNGIVIDDNGNEYYIDSSVLACDPKYLKHKVPVFINVVEHGGVLYGKDVTLRTLFIRRNLKTSLFTARDFFSGKLVFENLKTILILKRV